MSIAVDADVSNLDRVRPDIANQSRPHEKTVAVVLNIAPIIVVKCTRLDRVALANEILTKEIRDVNVLLTPIETVQPAISVLLKLREVRCVELVTVVSK